MESARKYVVAVDCEGVACVVGARGRSLTQSPDFSFARLQATREADAAARALFDAGASQVIVWDNHGASLNLDYDLLDERCDIALGVGHEGRFPELDETFSGVLFVGYHAKDATVDAPMCHTYSSSQYQYVKFNGREVGEIAIDAAVAGSRNVPVIFVSSDDKGVAEARALLPNVASVTTKKGLGWNAAVSKHPKRVVAEIYRTVKETARAARDHMPFRFEEPISAELRFKRLEEAEALSRRGHGWVRIDAYTVRNELQTVHDFFTKR